MHPAVVGSAVDMFHQPSQAVPTPPVMAPPPPVVPVYAPAGGASSGDVGGLPYDPYNANVKKRRKPPAAPPQPPPAPPVTTLLVTEEKTNMQSAAELGVIGGKSINKIGIP